MCVQERYKLPEGFYELFSLRSLAIIVIIDFALLELEIVCFLGFGGKLSRFFDFRILKLAGFA